VVMNITNGSNRRGIKKLLRVIMRHTKEMYLVPSFILIRHLHCVARFVTACINIIGCNEQQNNNKTETRSTHFDTNTYIFNTGVLSDKDNIPK